MEIPDLPVTLTVASLRDRILTHLKSTLAASRIKLDYGAKTMANSNTLAMFNLDDGDEIVLSVRDAKKK